MIANAPDEDKRPASRRVADALLARIESGELPLGEALPGYRSLAQEYGVAVNTAMAAVRLLRDRGVVTIKPQSGAHVREPAQGVDLAAELKQARTEIGDLRAAIRRFETALVDLEGRISALVDHVDETDRTS